MRIELALSISSPSTHNLFTALQQRSMAFFGGRAAIIIIIIIIIIMALQPFVGP
jgi:hypothetical protein